MKPLFALLSGIVFGLGLIISGMTNPAKIRNFLDIAGSWDPSLAFVMGAALSVSIPGFVLVGKRARPLFGDVFHMPTKRDIDAPLLTGSALFGIGWGIGGFCPGPAITALSSGLSEPVAFVVAMMIGLALANIVKSRPTRLASV